MFDMCRSGRVDWAFVKFRSIPLQRANIVHRLGLFVLLCRYACTPGNAQIGYSNSCSTIPQAGMRVGAVDAQ